MQGRNSPASSEVLLILAQTDAQRDIAGRASIPMVLQGPLGIMVRDAYRVLRMSFGMTGASAPSRGHRVRGSLRGSTKLASAALNLTSSPTQADHARTSA